VYNSRFEDVYEDLDWSIEIINQYCIELTVGSVSIRIPIRNTAIGEMAYFPREETFEKKEQAIDIVEFDTDYIPNPTPNSSIKSTEDTDYIRITYNKCD
jgi:hypothetical protein